MNNYTIKDITRASGGFAMLAVAVHKKRERDPKKMRHHVVSHFT